MRTTRWDCLYGSALVAAAPLVFGAWLCSPRLRASLKARRTHQAPDLPPGRRAWIHGASVGEILSAGPVLEALSALGCDAALSCNTPTGLEAAGRQFPGKPVFAMPLDFSRPVERAFDRVKPSLLILLELEVWPQLLAEAERRKVPVLCVNARITARSFRRYRLVRPLFAGSFSRIAGFLPQGEEHAGRLRRLGVLRDRIRVIPNLKGAADIPPRPDWIPEGDPVLVAGSTHPGEEAAVLDAWQALPGWRLVLAPRHPERFAEVADLLKARRIPFARRSAPVPGAWRVLLLDTMGDLRAAYAAADLAFVGGSLAPVGGHNVLEPAAAGVPVIVGPHTTHVAADVQRLEAAGGLRRIRDVGGLREAGLALSREPRRQLPGSGSGLETLREALGACLRTP